MGKIAIYTSIFGGYDNLQEQPSIDGVDYICFTDSKIESSTWDIVPSLPLYKDPNRNAKKYKILPHRYLKKYEYSIWIDGNFSIVSDPKILLKKYLTDKNIAFFNHQNTALDPRNCIYKEAEAIFTLGQQNFQRTPERGEKNFKDNPDIISKQINKYKNEGYPSNNGLIKGGVILRKHNEPDVIETMENWWEEIKYNSKRDQLSFNYVAWKNDLEYNFIPGDLRNNNLFKQNSKHKGK